MGRKINPKLTPEQIKQKKIEKKERKNLQKADLEMKK